MTRSPRAHVLLPPLASYLSYDYHQEQDKLLISGVSAPNSKYRVRVTPVKRGKGDQHDTRECLEEPEPANLFDGIGQLSEPCSRLRRRASRHKEAAGQRVGLTISSGFVIEGYNNGDLLRRSWWG